MGRLAMAPRVGMALWVAVGIGAAAPALAQQRRPAASPPSAIGLRLYGFGQLTRMAASQTFEAVTGSPIVDGVGGGAEALGVWRGLFLRVEAVSAAASGERVAVANGTAVSLGIPLSVEMRQTEFGLGWRAGGRRRSRVTPYVGGAFNRMHYVETSDFADTENADEYLNGYVVFAGVDVAVWGWVMVGAEVQRSGFPNAIGTGGASKAYGERDLGGATARVLVGIRR